MRIDSIRAENYKCFADSTAIPLEPGINLVVGRNSAGKSAFLEACSLAITGAPHRSLASLPHPDTVPPPLSMISATMSFSGAELRRSAMRLGSDFYFELPQDLNADEASARLAMQTLEAAEQVRLDFRAVAEPNTAAVLQRVPQGISVGNQAYGVGHTANFRANEARSELAFRSLNGNGTHLADVCASFARSRIFRFAAERLALGHSGLEPNAALQQNAGNLANVLLALAANPARFADYLQFVREILPIVQAITVRASPNGGGFLEVMVWQHPLASQRDDLAFPLSRCGTGVGQVLAIVLAAVQTQDPQILLIDEPNSFLHPGASRALISVLKRFPKHQYIIATHAPEIIAEAGPCPVIRVEWAEGAAKCQRFSARTLDVDRALLQCVGARLSDVFGYDQILWSEGPSDAECFKRLIDSEGRAASRTAILPVRDTNGFEPRSIREIVDIYTRASQASALVPPSIAFLLDREDRTDTEIADVDRQTHGRVKFLDRRMIENYLLDAEALSSVLRDALDPADQVPSAADVRAWITAHGNDDKYHASRHETLSQAWLTHVHAGKLLRDLFADLTAARIEFRKTVHSPAILERLLRASPDAVSQLRERVRECHALLPEPHAAAQ